MIKKIPTNNFIDYTVEDTQLCDVCKSIGLIPCDHKHRDFRKRDRIDNLIDTVNQIVDYLNA